MLDPDKIINYIQLCRSQYKKGLLKHDIKNSTSIEFWDLPKDSLNAKKRELIAMAERGEDRPQDKKTALGIALFRYIRESSDCYDPIFKKTIGLIRPDWVLPSFDLNKEKLLKLAASGGARPNSHKSKLGIVLSNYIKKGRAGYDAKFAKQIKKLAPDWFVKTSDRKKDQLLDMARRGKAKPTCKMAALRSALYTYTRRKYRTYDPVFDKRIRKLAPHWFDKRGGKVNA